MRLHKLELHGFKSFADRTTFEFGPGITAIVGPNGCGKSNIVDAIRWVLGELNPRQLRGRQMMDVVFHGTRNRRPATQAEVLLTFINDEGRLPLGMQEVTVGRRLHRSGESEYLLNGDRCRLRDIRQLFMDTGVGVDTYSVMEQGKVDGLLQAGPRDRRFLFEEAAGISKFKSQRTETLRRLERVDQNLARLKDVLAEVDSRVRSVKHQAEKARRYKELEARIQRVGARLMRGRDARLIEKLARRTEEQQELARKLEAARTARAEGGAEHDRLQADAQQVRDELERTRHELVETRGRAASAADRIELGRTRLEELAADEQRFRADQQRLASRVAQLETELARCGEDVSTLAAARDAQQHALAGARDKESGLRRRMEALDAEIETHKQAGLAALEACAQARNELAAIEAEARMLDARRARIAARRGELGDRTKAREKEAGRAAKQLDKLRRGLARLAQEQAREQAALGQAEARLAELAERIGEERDRRAGVASRLELLEALERNREGIGDGTRWLLDQAAGGECSGVLGTVADLLDVPHWLAPAVAAALGRLAEAVVVADAAAARRLADLLAGAGKGGVALVPRDAAPAPPPRGLGATLAEQVAPGDPLAAHLLGDCVVAGDLDAALAAGGPGWRVVTGGGDLVAGGRIELAGEQQGGLVLRKDEIKARTREKKQVEQALARLEQERAAQAKQAGRLKEKLAELARKLHAEELAAQAAAGEQEQLGRELAAIHEEDQVLADEAAELEQTAGSLTERTGQLEEELAGQTAARQAADAALAELAAAMDELRGELNQVAQAWSTAQVRLAQTEEKERSARNLLDATQQDLGERRRELEQARLGEAQCSQRRGETTAMIEQEGEAGEQARAAVAVLDGRQAEFDRRLQEVTVSYEAARERLRGISDELDRCAERSQELAVARRELEVARENLHQRATEELGIDLSQPAEEDTSLDEPLAEDEEEAETEHEHEQEHEHEPEQQGKFDLRRLEKEYSRLRKKIARIGPINIDAIEELALHEERATFLRSQQDDLVRAQEELLQIIDKLETSCREKFAASFFEIRENFRNLFRKLFGGGKADLVLEEPDDLLESGIEIIARPPGKEPRSISLLSGGERAMTAIALLFAVYQTRPSPFCLLDEIDAPLDQANVDRFTRLVREFLAVSQFLIITHSKQTMQVADTLFGITASEPGVSKPVSVHLERTGRRPARTEERAAVASPA